jgi:hypothetical protein
MPMTASVTDIRQGIRPTIRAIERIAKRVFDNDQFFKRQAFEKRKLKASIVKTYIYMEDLQCLATMTGRSFCSLTYPKTGLLSFSE